MSKQVNTIWKTNEGSKVVWKLQAPKGILTFRTKKLALKWAETFKEVK